MCLHVWKELNERKKTRTTTKHYQSICRSNCGCPSLHTISAKMLSVFDSHWDAHTHMPYKWNMYRRPYRFHAENASHSSDIYTIMWFNKHSAKKSHKVQIAVAHSTNEWVSASVFLFQMFTVECVMPINTVADEVTNNNSKKPFETCGLCMRAPATLCLCMRMLLNGDWIKHEAHLN